MGKTVITEIFYLFKNKWCTPKIIFTRVFSYHNLLEIEIKIARTHLFIFYSI